MNRLLAGCCIVTLLVGLAAGRTTADEKNNLLDEVRKRDEIAAKPWSAR